MRTIHEVQGVPDGEIPVCAVYEVQGVPGGEICLTVGRLPGPAYFVTRLVQFLQQFPMGMVQCVD